MARRNFRAALGTSIADLVTAAAGKDTIIMACQVVNKDGVAVALATIDWTDASAAGVATELCFEAPVAAGDAIDALARPQLLEPGDKLRGMASAAGDLVVTGWLEELDQ